MNNNTLALFVNDGITAFSAVASEKQLRKEHIEQARFLLISFADIVGDLSDLCFLKDEETLKEKLQLLYDQLLSEA